MPEPLWTKQIHVEPMCCTMYQVFSGTVQKKESYNLRVKIRTIGKPVGPAQTSVTEEYPFFGLE
jgi:hypothetical protein